MLKFDEKDAEVRVVGAGLAGSEAAWRTASMGLKTVLYEMRPRVMTAAHQTESPAELVCSNSFRSDDDSTNAVGLCHAELRSMGSLIMEAADAHALPAGSALAVDRVKFSQYVEKKLKEHPLIQYVCQEIVTLAPEDAISTIIATGPLTSPRLAEDILNTTATDSLAFFDAIAPVVTSDSLNYDRIWRQSRYDKGSSEGDYLNCPLSYEEYENFVDLLCHAETVPLKDFEKDIPHFDGCLPVEVMALRGKETLRFGPMKPVGLTDPRTGKQPYAVVQLRQDNRSGTLWNMVGFQTKLTYKEQKRIFSTIPGMEEALFVRLGSVHKNTYIKSPDLLDRHMRLKSLYPRQTVRFAGQIMGVEGYVESATMGLLAGLLAAGEYLLKKDLPLPPETTSMGSLLAYVTYNAQDRKNFQPMNANFGLFPPIEKKMKKELRQLYYTTQAKKDFSEWKEDIQKLFN